jgi:hypothetical protein
VVRNVYNHYNHFYSSGHRDRCVVTYSTNWMGIANMKWYSDRGLTRKVSEVLKEDQRVGELKAGDTWTYDEITTYYSAGRIDIRGLDPEKYWSGWHEYSLPPMHGEDWNDFSGWLDNFQTHELWEFDDIIARYEQESDRKIRWIE